MNCQSTLALAVAAWIVSLSGCRAGLGGAQAGQPTRANVAAFVSVGDGLLQGQHLSVASEGMPLDDIVARTLRPGALQGPTTSGDVRLRQLAVIQHAGARILVPLGLIQNTSVGSIVVAPGDRVDLIDFAKVLPGSADPAGGEVIVTGEHKRAGERVALTNQMAKLSQLFTDVGPTSNIAVITRTSAGVLEQHIMPISNYGLGGEDKVLHMGDYWLQPGDVVNFTRFESLPIVRSGVNIAAQLRDAENEASPGQARSIQGGVCHSQKIEQARARLGEATSSQLNDFGRAIRARLPF